MKKVHTLFFIAFSLLLMSCDGEETDITPQIDADTTQEEFFAHLFEQCGETFSGEATFPEDTSHDLVGADLMATIQTCTEEEIQIALSAEGQQSRRWIINRADDGLRLRDEHINNAGTTPDTTVYRGQATDDGSATEQYFAAGDSTLSMIPEAESNVWRMELEGDRFVFHVERNEEPSFRAELTRN